MVKMTIELKETYFDRNFWGEIWIPCVQCKIPLKLLPATSFSLRHGWKAIDPSFVLLLHIFISMSIVKVVELKTENKICKKLFSK